MLLISDHSSPPAPPRVSAPGPTDWPPDEATGRPPAGWTGWPAHKQFALVLTHDVADANGFANCRQLAQLESHLGFRSAFYFAPRDPDPAGDALRAWLREENCEIGLIGRPPRAIWSGFRWIGAKRAARCNRRLQEWEAAGYRASPAPRQPGWLHLLNIAYDSSTADTDPSGRTNPASRTIFPHWVAPPPAFKGAHETASPPEGGYVELPRTLPLVSSVRLGSGETVAQIWLRKLDWIAERGGLALLNLPAGAVWFGVEPAPAGTLTADEYRRFLQQVQRRHGGLYWSPLPREMAAFVRALDPHPVPVPRRRVAMVTHSFYESDGRVIRYAEALADRGDTVDVFALRRHPALPGRETIRGVELHRIQPRYTKSAQSRFAYVWPLLRFLVLSSWELTRRQLRQPYAVVHVHNIPDFLVFSAWLPRHHGAGVILDIHDIVPEFYGSKFAASPEGLVPAGLKWIERRAAQFASAVIVSNDLWVGKFAARTGTGAKCSVFINNVDGGTFRPGLRTRHDGRLIVLFPGGLQWHQGLDLALRAFRSVSAELPQAEFHIYGDGSMKPALVALAAELGLGDCVRFFPPVRTTEIAGIMANADVGVVPKRADSFGNEAYSTKIMEFMSLGVPVVVSRTQIDQFYFDDSVVRFFESGNVPELAAALLDVLRQLAPRQRMVARALDYSRRHSWESRRPAYLELVDRLAAGPARPCRAA